jgi:hypothetical protein
MENLMTTFSSTKIQQFRESFVLHGIIDTVIRTTTPHERATARAARSADAIAKHIGMVPGVPEVFAPLSLPLNPMLMSQKLNALQAVGVLERVLGLSGKTYWKIATGGYGVATALRLRDMHCNIRDSLYVEAERVGRDIENANRARAQEEQRAAAARAADEQRAAAARAADEQRLRAEQTHGTSTPTTSSQERVGDAVMAAITEGGYERRSLRGIRTFVKDNTGYECPILQLNGDADMVYTAVQTLLGAGAIRATTSVRGGSLYSMA